MRFLVTSNSEFQVPPELGPGMIDALAAWADKHTQSGKLEMVWSDAGSRGGGGILNVDSLEELDAIMTEFPAGPFSNVEVTPIVDLHESLQRGKQAMEAMMGG
jgi:muconolactone delta-isomerase